VTFSWKRFAVAAGATCAIAGLGPVALANAATTPVSGPIPVATALPDPTLGLPVVPLPALPSFPSLFGIGSSGTGNACGANQGLPPGFLNLGPTGPLGPLGPGGPLGNGNNNLPCGISAFNLGPSGPLGPGGLLGGGATGQ
jgi:hypothetical protein